MGIRLRVRRVEEICALQYVSHLSSEVEACITRGAVKSTADETTSAEYVGVDQIQKAIGLQFITQFVYGEDRDVSVHARLNDETGRVMVLRDMMALVTLEEAYELNGSSRIRHQMVVQASGIDKMLPLLDMNLKVNW